MGATVNGIAVEENISTGKLRVSGDIKTGGGGSVEARWGQIEGELADQTDLMEALDAKANETDLEAVELSVTDLGNEVETKAEKACVVSFTYNAQEDSWIIDKPALEIYVAYMNGQLVLAKLNNRRAVFTLSSIYREEVPDIATGAYSYEIWFSAVFGEVIHRLYYSYQPTGTEGSEIVYETYVEYTPQVIPDASTLPRRVTFETEGSGYISWDDFDDVREAFGEGAEVYAVLDGWDNYTLGAIEMEYGTDAGTMWFSHVDAVGSSIVFKTLEWHHESGADDRVTLTTKTLAAWEGGSY